jgi:hypothetical protein
MPNNGDKNIKFGVYRNVCCGEEIILPEDVSFPDCSRHRNLPTIWKSQDGDEIVKLTRLKQSSSNSAA